MQKSAHHSIHYGVVFLNRRTTGLRVIKKLNGKRFKHNVIEVREFIIRSKHNDRRLNQKQLPREIQERRKQERRREMYAGAGSENRLLVNANIFDLENVYLPRKRKRRA
ncbi:MAG: hypothetical protein PHH11_00185 [Methylomonas sp.]|nr:hypothetical protein [Methylomonas sp.]